MQNWVIVDEKYLDYLREFESRIPYSNYGEANMKPFFGALFEVDAYTILNLKSLVKISFIAYNEGEEKEWSRFSRHIKAIAHKSF